MPDLVSGDIHTYSIEFPSTYTYAFLKTFISVEGYQYFSDGLVSNCLTLQQRAICGYSEGNMGIVQDVKFSTVPKFAHTKSNEEETVTPAKLFIKQWLCYYLL